MSHPKLLKFENMKELKQQFDIWEFWWIYLRSYKEPRLTFKSGVGYFHQTAHITYIILHSKNFSNLLKNIKLKKNFKFTVHYLHKSWWLQSQARVVGREW